MTLQKAYKFSHRLVKPIVLVWLLCQSMLLCAAGVTAQPNSLHSGMSQVSLAAESLQIAAPALDMNQASADMMSHHSHGLSDLSHHTMVDSNSHSVDGSHESAQGNQCCGEKSKSTNVAFASLVPVGALFVIFWLIGLLVRRQSPVRWWQSPTVGYHYPRHHLVNCSFLN